MHSWFNVFYTLSLYRCKPRVRSRNLLTGTFTEYTAAILRTTANSSCVAYHGHSEQVQVVYSHWLLCTLHLQNFGPQGMWLAFGQGRLSCLSLQTQHYLPAKVNNKINSSDKAVLKGIRWPRQPRVSLVIKVCI